MRIVVTGGAGYIGSHTVLELLADGHEIAVLDNFSNATPESLRRVAQLTNRSFDVTRGDIRDAAALDALFTRFRPEAVIHFAGLKAVGESVAEPLRYYDHNVRGSLSLIEAMDRHGCPAIVFSSSATVYGDPDYLPYDEAHPRRPTNVYGRTKLAVEEMLADWCVSNAATSAVLLRYFNPVGAHSSGRIGEDPSDIPNNLMPFISQVAVGRRPHLSVFGSDYETRDGTGLRDYVHVVDLARAHVAAVRHAAGRTGCDPINLGTGDGATVLEVVAAFEKAAGLSIPLEMADRRPGDLPAYYADAGKARDVLGWQAEYGLEEICASAWGWQKANPMGYGPEKS
ncbi:UDP-glucose 4-epimerase GalE [Oceanomicrobium pacificus]|uniref:UDP-glucose 4-epimerase n=1 Tax=Oceanomicrobium pacificus TaxID=2692916 RepID=A0A6B0TZB4_9RHOB|nr:UDP-glucose 4-epimerase GalE [Oceanomicrobium pacificus]MXU66612.1 UDP-glucose 4-epimerase GalE [Oceanomicrobium pacificus]